ncbi:hypothetical protein [Avibacterium paragallinarum]|uniref:hypothetical protein n=1 Tax=Avibacterium paragallinarum TaxID=728 RepID=UPI00397A8B37
MRNILNLHDELSQHLIQLEGVIAYLEIDLAENSHFTVSNEIVSAMLWNASTLVSNARQTLEALEKAITQLKGGKDVQ